MKNMKKILNDINYYFSIRDEYKKISNLLDGYSESRIENKITTSVKTIAFVVNSINKFGGGTTSILRIGTYCEKLGYQIYFVTCTQSVKNAKDNARFALYEYGGKFITFSQAINMKFDVVVATYWETVYKVIRLSGYKIYFVQDYEPLFYKMSEEYVMALNTYKLGFHIVSLGAWNIEMIKQGCNSNSFTYDVITFPYEPNEYPFIKHDFSHMKRDKIIKIAIYIRNTGKRIPHLLQWFLQGLSMEMKKNGYYVELNYFGIDKRYPLLNGNNCGKLNKNQLFDLYEHSDFGVVASMTNVSLVPYEMIAAGLPVIDFAEGSFAFFIPKKCALITDFNYKELALRIVEVINRPECLQKMTLEARKQINDLSWKKTSNEFMNIIQSVVKRGDTL